MIDDRGQGRRGAKGFTSDFLTELFGDPLDPGYTDAASQREKTGRVPRSGWSVGPVSLVVIVLLGFLFAVAYRQTVAAEPGRAQARSGLVAQIQQRQGETDALSTRAEELRDEVNRQREAALGGSQAARLRELEASTGLGRVTGDGVVVELADAPGGQDALGGATAGAGPAQVIYLDLQSVANDLWGAGAEAIAINGQRLTSTSTIRSAGQAILVDFRPVTGPYEVSAIGPDGMRQRYEASGSALTMRQVAKVTGLSFAVRDADDLALPAAPEPRLRYAEPAVSSSASSGGDESSGSGASPSPSGGGR
ncbi:DUF881 domain-containing protein [Micromonospora sp. HNM0581]|uniref:DUF881 domain-containing protein n=1 Tax=Micromonospora sp. HNM0581 TaxID=2716341 RepID=UPI00146A264C|nr:DUF881 domain-containing protein [Micromonospora sp. HNM0581]NLU78678.1 DUF881 domain-containing protein [Micromonospora sp. HNM0581]